MAREDTQGGDDLTLSLPRLLACPNEVVVPVLCHLSWADLLSLRRTNHALHDLVHRHQKVLVQEYRSCSSIPGFTSMTITIGRHDDLAELSELVVREREAQVTGEIIASRIISKLTFRHAPFSVDELRNWKEKKCKRLADVLRKCLFALHDFFVQLRQSFLEATDQFSLLSDDELLALGQVFELDQQYAIERIEGVSLIDITQTWRTLQAITVAIGLSSPRQPQPRQLPAITVRSLIAMQGFARVTKVIRSANFEYGGKGKADKIVGAILAEDSRERPFSTRRLATITYLRQTKQQKAENVFLRRGNIAQVKFMEQQNFWEKAAMSVMQRKGVVGSSSPEIDTLETWLRAMIAERGDPWFEFGRWNRPDVVA